MESEDVGGVGVSGVSDAEAVSFAQSPLAIGLGELGLASEEFDEYGPSPEGEGAEIYPRDWEKAGESGGATTAEEKEKEKQRGKRRRSLLTEEEGGLLSTTPVYRRSLLGG